MAPKTFSKFAYNIINNPQNKTLNYKPEELKICLDNFSKLIAQNLKEND